MSTKEEYLNLCNEIIYHNKLYYEDCNPVISDHEYDLLLSRLQDIENNNPDWILENSPVRNLGDNISSNASSILAHKHYMLSIANAYNKEEILSFFKRNETFFDDENIDYFTELKMDGIAVTVRFVDGIFVKALTRGNGRVGEDITNALNNIISFPKTILHKGSFLEVRGEVFMTKKALKLLNEDFVKNGRQPLANTRNASGGTLKLLDSEEIKKRNLSVAFYNIAECDGFQNHPNTQNETVEFLKHLGLPVIEKYKLCKTIEDVFVFTDYIESIRSDLAYDIDGVVLKINSLNAQKKLGTTAKHYKWAIAYKFSPQQAQTFLKSISLQVGRTGVITPIAELEPVLVSGSTISRASLHNEDFIFGKDIRENDTVLVEKGGDVIPKIVSVVLEKRNLENSKPYQFPVNCPDCGHSLYKEGSFSKCLNKLGCSAQIIGKLIFFTSKTGMNIDHCGDKTMETLWNKGLVRSFSDIYKLKYEDLESLDGFKSKSINNILESIERSKTTTFSRFVSSLGIDNIGEEGGKLLALHFKSDIDLLMDATVEQLIQIRGIGEKVAESITCFFANKDNRDEIKELISLGITFQKEEENKNGSLSGKLFVFTGSLQLFTRQEAKSRVKALGGVVSESITSKVSFLVVGLNAGSKLDKAKKLGIDVLSEEEFLLFLDKI